MSLPKINGAYVNDKKNKQLLDDAKKSMFETLFSEEMSTAMRTLQNKNPQDQQIQELCTAYNDLQRYVTPASDSFANRNNENYVSMWNNAMDCMKKLAGYDTQGLYNGVYNEENTLFGQVNKALDNKSIDTKTFTTLMTLDNGINSKIAELSTYGKQMSANVITGNLQSELNSNKNYSYEKTAQFFEMISKNKMEQVMFDDAEADKFRKGFEKTYEKNKKLLDDSRDNEFGMEGIKNREAYKANMERAANGAQSFDDMCKFRDGIMKSAKQNQSMQQASDREYDNMRDGMRNNDYSEQVMQFLDRNIKQMDKGRRLFHRDSKEFKAMKTEMQDLKKYLNDNKGKVNLDTLKEKLDHLGNTATKYTDAKKTGLNVGSNMRQMRLNLADNLQKFTNAASKSIQANDKLVNNTDIVNLKNEVQKSRLLRPPFDTTSKEKFIKTGLEATSVYRKNQKEYAYQKEMNEVRRNMQRETQKETQQASKGNALGAL